MMPESMRQKVKNFIVGHEDCRNFPYIDTLGNITIGIGYNLTNRGMPDSWIIEQYEADVAYFYNQLFEDFTWFRTLDQNRQMVLLDMCCMGYKKFKEFTKMLNALAVYDYKTASQEMINSVWATETKSRAAQDAQVMLTGEV